MKILRVFPRRTSYTPKDNLVVIGLPKFDDMIPEHDEIHISCAFTWDKADCEYLQKNWQSRTDKPVLLGGPAFGSPANDFVPGRYMASGITFTSRGCNNNCSWCIVPKIEGKLRELPVVPGNVIQDNNFLQLNRTHKEKTFEMLKKQRAIQFKGGLECDLIDDHFVDAVAGLKIDELWLACDSKGSVKRFLGAMQKLKRLGLRRDRIRTYALIGDDKSENMDRLMTIYHAGSLPHAQLYRDFGETKTEYPIEWREFESVWQKPYLMEKFMAGKATGKKRFDREYAQPPEGE